MEFSNGNYLFKSITVKSDRATIWDVLLHPDDQWGNAFGGAFVKSDWKVGSTVIWTDIDENVVAHGKVITHNHGNALNIQYYDSIQPEASATPGDYWEKYELAATTPGTDYILSIEIGELAANDDNEAHSDMWDKALFIIKEISEKRTAAN